MDELVISDVQLSDRFPPDCANPPSAMCQPAKEGFQVLVVWLEKKDGSDPGSVEGKLFDASKGVSVKAEDGSQTDSFPAGLTNGKLFVAFTPPVSARNFTLSWPDNLPIEPGKQDIHWQMKTNITHEKALKRAAAQHRVQQLS